MVVKLFQRLEDNNHRVTGDFPNIEMAPSHIANNYDPRKSVPWSV